MLPDFLEKLRTPLNDKELNFEKKDFVKILQDLSEKAQVKIDFDKLVLQLEPSMRLWNLTIAPKTSIDMVLQRKLLVQFPWLKVNYKYDHVVVMQEGVPKTKVPNAAPAPPVIPPTP